uniref:DUF4378 domain-containing protein n=1 Tax=Solanum lycopersicum TaxID=4081 RepID=A0A3Q7ICM5_SOLLC
MRTHLVECEDKLLELDSASSVSLVDACEKDSTTKSTFTNFNESPYWKFRYIRDIIRSLDLVTGRFMLSETHSVILLDLFDQLENQKARTNHAEEKVKIRRTVLFNSVVECLEFS